MCGIPLVMYELPNLDITRNAKGMIVVPQSDIEAAAHEIVKLFKDDIYKKEIGRQARESAEEFYSIDLAKHWQSIFELSVQPPKPIVPLYKLSAEEVAVRMAVEYYRDGIIKRGVNSGDTTYLSMRCAELEHTLEEFRRSESYRIGMIITFIPRKIKALLKKIFKRKK